MHSKPDTSKIVRVVEFATRGIFIPVFALLALGAPQAHAFDWYGPGNGIDYTGFVYNYNNGGIGFSWPWTFVDRGSVNYSGFGGYGGWGGGYKQPTYPPQFQQVGSQSVRVGNLLQFTVNATNNYGGAITYSATNLPTGAAFNASTRTFSWMPTATQTGYFNVNFRATDRVGSSDMAVTITVNAVQAIPAYNPYTYGGSSYYGGSGYTYGNSYYGSDYYNQYNGQRQISPLNSNPVIYPIQQQTVRAGDTLRIQVQGYDRDGDYLQYSMTGEPQGAVFDQYSRTFIWTPTPLQVGQYRVNFRVSQGGQQYADTGVAIYVLDRTGNLPYTSCSAGPGPYLFGFSPSGTVREGDLFSYQIIAGSGNGNQASYRIVDGPIGLSVDAKTGYMRWVPSFNQSGTYPVRLGVYNGQCETVQTFTITVQDVR